MSLLAASRITDNTEAQARVRTAIRKVAATHLDADGPAGQLARAGYTAPETIAPAFMLRVATNGDVTGGACESCGHVAAGDDTIEWIVGDAWAAVAAELYPAPAA